MKRKTRAIISVLLVVILMSVMQLNTLAYIIVEGQRFYTTPIIIYTDTEVTSNYVTALKNAMNTWNSAGKGTLFVYGGVKPVPFPNIKEGFNCVTLDRMGTGQDISIAVTSKSVGQRDNLIYEGDISVNISYNYIFSPGPSNGYDAETMFLHELGHMLGLYDCHTPGSVMEQPQYPNTFRRALNWDDVAALNILY